MGQVMVSIPMSQDGFVGSDRERRVPVQPLVLGRGKSLFDRLRRHAEPVEGPPPPGGIAVHVRSKRG